MNGIQLKKLIVSGNKGVSTIEFGKYLTIISGPSNTGKSWIYRCIDYIFGAGNSKRPFEPSIGYNSIELELITRDTIISLSRKIGENTTIVNTTIDNIQNGSYSKDELDNLLLKLIGIEQNIKIPKNQSGVTQRLTWRTIKQILMMHEDNTETEESILLYKMQSRETALLSSLLYFLYEQDFSSYDSDGSKETKKIRKGAVQNYIINQREKLIEKKKAIEETIADGELNSNKLNDIVKDLYVKLDDVQDKMNKAVESNQSLTKHITETQNKINSGIITLKKYESLETQYAADIKRLSFIVDNESIIKDNIKPTNCPFCNSKTTRQDNASYIDGSRGELIRIVTNLEELSLSKTDIEEDVKANQLILKDLISKQKEIEDMQNDKFIPMKDKLTKEIANYQSIIQFIAIQNFEESLNEDLKELDKNIDKKIDYKPKQLFPDSFFEDIAKNYINILKETNYKNVKTVKFDRKTFDVIINDKLKKDNGKGYRSYFNSLLLLSLKKYFEDNAKYDPKFWLIDSPLHGLSVPENIEDEITIREGFFDYLVTSANKSQLIVIDNTNKHELPEIETNVDIKIYRFTGTVSKGRYGFLNGVTN